MGLGPLWLLASLAAPAADDGAGAGRLIDQLAACRALGADAARLACFDRTVGAVVDAQAKKDIVVLDRTEVRKAKRSLFGFSLPSIKLFGDGQDDDAIKQLAGTMTRSTPLPGGRLRFELDGGGAWETVEEVTVAPRKGDMVTIKAGSLGSYTATAPGRRSARVVRIR